MIFKDKTAQANITEEEPLKIKITFPYNPAYVEKIKKFKGSWWHPKEKYWTVPYSDEVVAKLLSIFDGEKIDLDPASQAIKENPKPPNNFEALKKELTSRKYSPRTIKAYLHYNEDFLQNMNS